MLQTLLVCVWETGLEEGTLVVGFPEHPLWSRTLVIMLWAGILELKDVRHITEGSPPHTNVNVT